MNQPRRRTPIRYYYQGGRQAGRQAGTTAGQLKGRLCNLRLEATYPIVRWPRLA